MTNEPRTEQTPPTSSPPALTSERLARVVCDLPPQQWREVRRRIEAVERYLAAGQQNNKAAIAAAKELGVSERIFYLLVESYRAHRSVRPDAERRGRRRSTDQTVARMIADASRALGPSATPTTIHAVVAPQAEAAGLAVPTVSMVRTRMLDPPERPDVPGALGREMDLVLDLAPLAAWTEMDNIILPTRLLTLIDARAGQVAAAKVLALEPLEDMVAQLLRTGLAPYASMSLATTRDIIPSRAILEIAAAANIRFDEDASSGLGPGVAIKAIFGGRIGDIRILTETSTKRPARGKTVLLADLQAGIDLLVKRRNSEVSHAPPDHPTSP